jgi:integral membrane sensor domain MASE1
LSAADRPAHPIRNREGFLPRESFRDTAALPLWLRVGLFGLAFFACAHLGRFLSVRETSYVSFWLPSGLYMGVLLLHQTRAWPRFMLAALAAGLAFDLSLGTPLPTALGFTPATPWRHRPAPG